MFDEGAEATPPSTIARVRRYNRPTTVKYDNAVKMAREIGIIPEGDSIHTLVSGNFIFGDLIEAYLTEHDLCAHEMIIAVLSLSQENVDSLRNLQMGGYVGRMGLIVSDFFFSHYRATGVKYICEELGQGRFTFAAAGIHTKVVLMKGDGFSLVLSGSANLRSSRNVEQFAIDHSPELYTFHREWMATILNQYTATHQSLRGSELWQTLQEPANAAASPNGGKATRRKR